MKGCDYMSNTGGCCEFYQVHQDIVDLVKQKLPEEEDLYSLADLFKVFGDSTRIKILYLLLEAPMCVCDIATLLTMSQSAISHQLRVLKQAKLVKFKRNGKAIFYSLADGHVAAIIEQGMTHIKE